MAEQSQESKETKKKIGFTAKNIAAQLRFRVQGNPPLVYPDSAISNCFPGLEMDFRAVWRRIFREIILHESSNLVIDINYDPTKSGSELPDLRQHQLQSLSIQNGAETITAKFVTNVEGPREPGGKAEVLGSNNLEWSNALAAVLPRKSDIKALCKFLVPDGDKTIEVELTIRPLFEPSQSGLSGENAVIARSLLAPGELGQGLCSPWQNDYRECGCHYWAASRPDFVNVEPDSNGVSQGHNWMQKNRSSSAAKTYIVDNFDELPPEVASYDDLFKEWEKHLRFLKDGKDDDII